MLLFNRWLLSFRHQPTERAEPTQLTYRRNVYSASRRLLANHTRELTYRGVAYHQGTSYSEMADNWL